MVRYTPKQGDIIWLDFDPQSGHEQRGRRPALVVSSGSYNEIARPGAIICPITNTFRDIPTHIRLENIKSTGFVMCEQVKALDISSRNPEFIESAPIETVDYVNHIIKLFFALED